MAEKIMTTPPDIMEKARELADQLHQADCPVDLSEYGNDFVEDWSKSCAHARWLNMNLIAAALAEASAVPNGWVMVPVEPLEETIQSMHDTYWATIQDWREVYHAMLKSAAPKPPIAAGGK